MKQRPKKDVVNNNKICVPLYIIERREEQDWVGGEWGGVKGNEIGERCVFNPRQM